MSSTKLCKVCNNSFPNTNEFFDKNQRTKDGLQRHCKGCSYLYSIKTYYKSKYGLEYDFAISLKNQPCEICGDDKYGRIDHCHTSNQVRGTLCNRCNTGIGQFKEDLLLLRNAIEYLQKYRNEHDAHVCIHSEEQKIQTWEDCADDLSCEIAKHHPLQTGRHSVYERALQLVSNRHSKGALVDLVNYLLVTGIDKQTPVMGDGALVEENPLNDAQIGLSPSSPANTCQIANIFIQRGCNEHKALEYAEQAVKYLSANTSDWQTVRDALEFYANEDNWTPTEKYGPACMSFDLGRRAREALAIATRNAKLNNKGE